MTTKYLGYRLAQWVSLRLPAEGAFRCAERLADAWRRSSARDRAAVEANLSTMLGATGSERAALVRETFRNFGRYLVEFFTSHRLPQPEVRLDGYEHLLSAQARHRGTIVLTGHLGNWELGAVLLQRMGFHVSVVALPHDDPHMDALFNAQRRRSGLHVVPLGPQATRLSLASLHEGHLLGVLGDREFGHNGLTVAVNGRCAMTLPRGPAILSLRAQAPVVPSFLIREGRWKFRFCFEPPIWPEAHEVSQLIQRYAAVLERYVKRFPAQWLMFQPVVSPTG